MGKTVNHHLFLENFPDAFTYIRILRDGEGNPVDHLFLEVNPAFEKMTGLRKEQILGKRATEVYPRLASFPLNWGGIYSRIIDEKDTVRFDSYSLPAERWYEITALSDAPGYFAITFRKTTDSRPDAAKELRKTAEWMEHILRATRSSIDILDSDYNLLYVDEYWQAIYGPPKGRKCYEYFKGRSHPCDDCGAPRALKTKKVTISEQVLPREGHRIVECHAVPYQDERGKWLVAEFKTDITRRKELERNLEFRLRFEKMISEITNTFIEASVEKMHAAINRALQRVGEFFGMGRGVIFKSIYDGKFMKRTYEWCAEGSRPLEGALERFSATDLPWLFAQPQEERALAFDTSYRQMRLPKRGLSSDRGSALF